MREREPQGEREGGLVGRRSIYQEEEEEGTEKRRREERMGCSRHKQLELINAKKLPP